MPVDRRAVLKAMSAVAVAGAGAARPQPAAAQQVKRSAGTEAPKLQAPADATDCHHHIYDARYPADPRSTLRPGDASVEDYRALQRRIGTSRNVIVQPSTYGTDNSCALDALAAFGPTARAVVVVDTSVADAELTRMNGLGVRGIRFNLAQAGATTPAMIEPLSKRVNDLGWHIQINAPAAKIIEIKDILSRVPSRMAVCQGGSARRSRSLWPHQPSAPRHRRAISRRAMSSHEKLAGPAILHREQGCLISHQLSRDDRCARSVPQDRGLVQ